MPYIGNQPGTGVRSRFIYTATASQTTFSGADDNSKTLKYADSAYVDVFLNGVCLVPGTDYTASTKTSIVLTQAASVSDTLEVIAYDIASMSDMSASNGGTFQADVTFADGADIITASKGTDNVRLGENAGAAIASGGNNNVAIGKDALASNTTADNSTAVGFEAGTNSTGAQNTFFGRKAGRGVTSGTENTFVGNSGGRDSTITGDYNIGIGSVPLNALTSGSNNIAMGRETLGANTTADNNTAIGHQALALNTTATNNVAVGANTLQANTTGGPNTAVGKGAMASNTTGSEGSAFGFEALVSCTTGSQNTAIGRQAGYSCSTGTVNTFLGEAAGYFMTTGSKNVVIGRFNGNQHGHDIRTASNQIVLSDGDGYPRMRVTSVGTIGFGMINAASSIATTIAFTTTGNGTHNSHYYKFGPHYTSDDPAFYVINESSVGVYLPHGNNSWNAHSDERIKENITSLGTVLPNIENLRCVKYNLKGQTHTKIGFIAQDWETNFSEVIDESSRQVIEADGTVSMDSDSESTTKVKSMSYTETIPVLLKAIQELSAKNDALEARIATLEG